MLECSEQVINAKVFANKFREICTDFIPPTRKANGEAKVRLLECNNNILEFLSKIKILILRGRCDGRTFKERVIKSKSDHILNIEIFWYLLKYGIIKDEDILSIFDLTKQLSITEYLSSCTFKNIFLDNKENSVFWKEMNSDFLAILLKHKEKCDSKRMKSLPYSNFMDLLSSKLTSQGNKIEMLNIKGLVELLQITSLENSLLQLFLTEIVEVYLRGKSLTLEDMMHQYKCHLENDNTEAIQNFNEIFIFFNSTEINSFLQKLLLNNSSLGNCQNLLNFISGIIKSYGDSVKFLKTLIQSLLEKALEDLNEKTLLLVFVLARHCSSLRVANFPSYIQWFSSTFSGESSRPINTKEKSIFFINFLTQLSKYDSHYYLKVHINRVPCVPIECQSLVSDFVKLVKTILFDMNESTELGLFENFDMKDSVDHDVEKVVSIFENTNDIPKCVLEASIFHKTYYEKKFLIKLLSKYEGKNSVRHKLIMKLQSLGKVPNSLYFNYKQMI